MLRIPFHCFANCSIIEKGKTRGKKRVAINAQWHWFVVAIHHYIMTAVFVILLIGAAFCAVMMSLHDWRRRIIPDVYLFPFFLAGLLVVSFFPWFFDAGEAAVAAATGYALGAGIGCIFSRLAKSKEKRANDARGKAAVAETAGRSSPSSVFSEPIGLGDVKLLAAGGAWLGVTGLAIALVASCALGGIWGLLKKQKFIPFAPFFFAGAIVAIIFMIIYPSIVSSRQFFP
jgi:prepilin signal peptidase PulO-like enzyme (type II secretory pathway)